MKHVERWRPVLQHNDPVNTRQLRSLSLSLSLSLILLLYESFVLTSLITSAQISPDCDLMFGWYTRVTKRARGALNGYSPGNCKSKWKTPPAYGECSCTHNAPIISFKQSTCHSRRSCDCTALPPFPCILKFSSIRLTGPVSTACQCMRLSSTVLTVHQSGGFCVSSVSSYRIPAVSYD